MEGEILRSLRSLRMTVREKGDWIPAFAGMTMGSGNDNGERE